jgi:ribosomal protein S18 acetylase RimI-like enzyme
MLHIRALGADDPRPLAQLLRRVAIFEPHEIAVAEELIALALGGSRDYLVHVAEDTAAGNDADGGCRVVGYVCHGHNPVTDALHDLYWIAVDPRAQRQGVGLRLIERAEECVRTLKGRGMVIETSSRDEYGPARRMYERCGYRKAAEIADFYKPGDDQIVYLKFFEPTGASGLAAR